MSKKILISVIAILILAAGIGVFFVFQKPVLPDQFGGKCNDGICDEKEKANPKLCPGDCVNNTISPGNATDLSPNQESNTSNYSSPFGFHPGSENNYDYMQDLGANWSREGFYVIWNWVDVERNGNFKFSDAKAEARPQAKKNTPIQTINYDRQWMKAPKNINIVTNVCPFIKGGSFANSKEEKTYQNFVEKMVERYDGDNDLGCTLQSPDCYNKGDKQYPAADVIMAFKKNPIKYWQMCNQVIDTCEGADCKENYARLYAQAMEKTYKGIKSADKLAQVLIAGDSPRDLYPAIFKELNGNYIDIIDFHRFGEHSNYDPKNDFDYLKKSLKENSFDLDKLKFWITETGTYSGDPIPIDGNTNAPYQDEALQASGLVKIYISALSYDIEKIFWAWNIKEGFQGDCGFFDYTGLIYDGCDCDSTNEYVCKQGIGHDLGRDVKKLSYYTYKKMLEVLDGSDWDNIQIIQNTNGAYVYKFVKNSKSIWVAWNDNANSQAITLNVDNIKSVKIIEAIPRYETGKEIADYSTAFNIETKNAGNNQVSMALKDLPVFIIAED